jgi:hypothetical protein
MASGVGVEDGVGGCVGIAVGVLADVEVRVGAVVGSIGSVVCIVVTSGVHDTINDRLITKATIVLERYRIFILTLTSKLPRIYKSRGWGKNSCIVSCSPWVTERCAVMDASEN